MPTVSEKEKQIQKFWEENKIFEKTLAATKKGPVFNFYDGPPFATGLPHYGHLVPSLMKDVVPRYWTMKGCYVERKWGWDCHGLPIENIVEKELNFKSKKEIEDWGVEKFNESCRAKVLVYAEEWKKTIARFGRWVDLDNAYRTMDLQYMESVWWVFKELWDRGLIYEGYKSMHVCPRCETTLSQFEVAEGYRDIKDLSLTAEFELADEPGTFVLAWTTTPWTLPGNVALAVGEGISYSLIQTEKGKYILASDLVKNFFVSEAVSFLKEFKGRDLVGKKYRPLFPYYLDQDLENKENLYTIVSADFVTTTDGTGVVHIAPAYGEEDLALGREKNLAFIQNIALNGNFKDEVEDFKGLNVKPAADTKRTDKAVIEYLKNKNRLFSEEEYSHSYPHCWRCDTPLINYAASSWFVKVAAIKEKALNLAQEINWFPKHIKEGRFGQWLEGARDWSISRQRFWASAIPVWRCPCGETRVFGSIEELEKASGEKISDLHKHVVDKIEVSCKCGGRARRIPDVLDCWFESGSMPYSQKHYPFENKKEFENIFPAEFIAEGVDQTRAWFYYLHLIAVAVRNQPAFKNAIVNGIVLAEGGKKMSKKLQNYPEPEIVMEKYGADALRYYLLSSPITAAENMNFSEKEVKEAMQKVVMLIGNILNFYRLYQPELEIKKTVESENILDQWLAAKLHLLIKETTEAMERYDLAKAVRPIQSFIDEFSTWWLRRSRDRFKGKDRKDKQSALQVFRYALLELAKVMAPFTPFLAEEMYLSVKGGAESVHLEKWPKFDEKLINRELISQMAQVRKIAELGLAARMEKGIKIRQPLNRVKVFGYDLNEYLSRLLREELNVKKVEFEKGEVKVVLDAEITEELKVEGALRELTRVINDLRKKTGLTINDRISVFWRSEGEAVKKVFSSFREELSRAVMAGEFLEKENQGEEKEINGEKARLEIRKN